MSVRNGVVMTAKTTGQHWYIARDGKQTGPISTAEISAIAGHGYFKETDLVWQPGLADWQPAFNLFPPNIAAPAPAATAARETIAEPSQRPRPRLNTAPTTGPQPATVAATAATNVPPPATADAQFGWPADDVADPAGKPTAARGGLELAPRPRTGEPLSLRPPPKDAKSAARQTGAGANPTNLPVVLEPRSNRTAVAVLTASIAAIATGLWIAAYPDLLAGLPPAGSLAKAVGADSGSEPGAGSQLASIEQRLQQTAHWPVIKREFPDWYGDRLREAAKLKSEKKSDDDIAKVLVDQMVILRRQYANQALAASAPRLKALAAAFLENLRQLKSQSTTTCFNFISHGETTPGVIDLLQVADGKPPLLQLHMAAVFEAIGEGRKTPIVHEKPQKADYDILMDQLAKLGWTQADVATFADPDRLARTAPDRVCQLVQDWFVALISIQDAGVQDRLLGETLRPVVSG